MLAITLFPLYMYLYIINCKPKYFYCLLCFVWKSESCNSCISQRTKFHEFSFKMINFMHAAIKFMIKKVIRTDLWLCFNSQTKHSRIQTCLGRWKISQHLSSQSNQCEKCKENNKSNTMNFILCLRNFCFTETQQNVSAESDFWFWESFDFGWENFILHFWLTKCNKEIKSPSRINRENLKHSGSLN